MTRKISPLKTDRALEIAQNFLVYACTNAQEAGASLIVLNPSELVETLFGLPGAVGSPKMDADALNALTAQRAAELSAMGKQARDNRKELVELLGDGLSLTAFCDKFGTWVIAEYEYDTYYLIATDTLNKITL